MIGAIAGDIIGSRFEGFETKSKDFDLFTKASTFTDDTVLTVAVADCIMHGGDFTDMLRKYGQKYPKAGYGGTFIQWLAGIMDGPYNSWGNGSAMRVSPVGFAFNEQNQVLKMAERSAAITHNHPEGIKGAQAIAMSVFLARMGHDKLAIQSQIEKVFHYNLERRIDEIRPGYSFDVSCQGSVPEAIIAFLESVDFEDAIRTAISLGGDSDTIACMAGGIAQSYYGTIPVYIINETKARLPEEFLSIIDKFEALYLQ